jgi:putative restriction endonuclease
MRFFVGVTDYDWFRFLAGRPDIDEVNFWQPSGGVPFRALQPGELFLFKLHAPRHFIVGGGFFAHWTALPVSLAWEAFGPKNGAPTLQEVRTRLAKYRNVEENRREDYTIGCTLLEQPFFLDETEWIPAPADWKRNIVRGKGYDASTGDGQRLWQHVMDALQRRSAPALPLEPEQPVPAVQRYGKPVLTLPRLGQGTFRVWVSDLYARRCAVTGERTFPVLDAAHIRPYDQAGPHDPRNGLLLRTDLHRLLDSGYATVTPDLRFWVSTRIREEFANGRDYYALDGRQLRGPTRPELAPSREYLEWHADNVFRG